MSSVANHATGSRRRITLIAGDIPTWRMDQMPYGGVKDSGAGREGLKYAIEQMTERKLLVMNLQ
jgi:acyl-CoA reductase-like NAD-dependent aldehyde dehydrogenase